VRVRGAAGCGGACAEAGCRTAGGSGGACAGAGCGCGTGVKEGGEESVGRAWWAFEHLP
jgi:hypothetical protein